MKSIFKPNLGLPSLLLALTLTACTDKDKPPTGPDEPGNPYPLEIAYDTLAGTVSLKWKESDSPLLADYAIFRDDVAHNEISRSPVAFVSGIAYVDTVFRTLPDSLGEDEPTGLYGFRAQADLPLRYRVLTRTLTGALGALLSHGQVRAIPPDRFRTFMELTESAYDSSDVPVGGTLRLRLDYANDSRTNRRLDWYVGTEPVRTVTDIKASGTDTLDVTLPLKAGSIRVRARLEDESGKIWVRSMDFQVHSDFELVADAGKDFIALMGDSVTIAAAARLRYGTITKWEWDIGGKGTFKAAAPGDTLIHLPGQADSAFLCVLRVTASNGAQALDTMSIVISPSWITASLPEEIDRRQVASFGDQIYLMGTIRSSKVYRFAPERNTWSVVSQLPRQRADFSVCEVDGKIYVMGGLEKGYASNWNPSDRVDRYDPLTGEWSEMTPSPQAFITQAVALDGRIYALNAREGYYPYEIFEYIASSDVWRSVETLPQGFSDVALRMGAGEGKVYFMPQAGKQTPTAPFRIGLGVYDPAADSWVTKPVAPNPDLLRESGFGMFKGKMIFPGGYNLTPWGECCSNDYSRGIQTYDPEANVWGTLLPSIVPSGRSLVLPMGDMFYVLGGSRIDGINTPALFEIVAYRP